MSMGKGLGKMKELIKSVKSKSVFRPKVVVICTTCFSKNRKCFVLNLKETKILAALGITFKTLNIVYVCWECKAYINNIIQFKEKALNSQRLMHWKMFNAKVTTKLSKSDSRRCHEFYIKHKQLQREELLAKLEHIRNETNKKILEIKLTNEQEETPQKNERNVTVQVNQDDFTKIKDINKPVYIVVNKANSFCNFKRQIDGKVTRNDSSVSKDPKLTKDLDLFKVLDEMNSDTDDDDEEELDVFEVPTNFDYRLKVKSFAKETAMGIFSKDDKYSQSSFITEEDSMQDLEYGEIEMLEDEESFDALKSTKDPTDQDSDQTNYDDSSDEPIEISDEEEDVTDHGRNVDDYMKNTRKNSRQRILKTNVQKKNINNIKFLTIAETQKNTSAKTVIDDVIQMFDSYSDDDTLSDNNNESITATKYTTDHIRKTQSVNEKMEKCKGTQDRSDQTLLSSEEIVCDSDNAVNIERVHNDFSVNCIENEKITTDLCVKEGENVQDLRPDLVAEFSDEVNMEPVTENVQNITNNLSNDITDCVVNYVIHSKDLSLKSQLIHNNNKSIQLPNTDKNKDENTDSIPKYVAHILPANSMSEILINQNTCQNNSNSAVTRIVQSIPNITSSDNIDNEGNTLKAQVVIDKEFIKDSNHNKKDKIKYTDSTVYSEGNNDAKDLTADLVAEILIEKNTVPYDCPENEQKTNVLNNNLDDRSSNEFTINNNKSSNHTENDKNENNDSLEKCITTEKNISTDGSNVKIGAQTLTVNTGAEILVEENTVPINSAISKNKEYISNTSNEIGDCIVNNDEENLDNALDTHEGNNDSVENPNYDERDKNNDNILINKNTEKDESTLKEKVDTQNFTVDLVTETSVEENIVPNNSHVTESGQKTNNLSQEIVDGNVNSEIENEVQVQGQEVTGHKEAINNPNYNVKNTNNALQNYDYTEKVLANLAYGVVPCPCRNIAFVTNESDTITPVAKNCALTEMYVPCQKGEFREIKKRQSMIINRITADGVPSITNNDNNYSYIPNSSENVGCMEIGSMSHLSNQQTKPQATKFISKDYTLTVPLTRKFSSLERIKIYEDQERIWQEHGYAAYSYKRLREIQKRLKQRNKYVKYRKRWNENVTENGNADTDSNSKYASNDKNCDRRNKGEQDYELNIEHTIDFANKVSAEMQTFNLNKLLPSPDGGIIKLKRFTDQESKDKVYNASDTDSCSKYSSSSNKNMNSESICQNYELNIKNTIDFANMQTLRLNKFLPVLDQGQGMINFEQFVNHTTIDNSYNAQAIHTPEKDFEAFDIKEEPAVDYGNEDGDDNEETYNHAGFISKGYICHEEIDLKIEPIDTESILTVSIPNYYAENEGLTNWQNDSHESTVQEKDTLKGYDANLLNNCETNQVNVISKDLKTDLKVKGDKETGESEQNNMSKSKCIVNCPNSDFDDDEAEEPLQDHINGILMNFEAEEQIKETICQDDLLEPLYVVNYENETYQYEGNVMYEKTQKKHPIKLEQIDQLQQRSTRQSRKRKASALETEKVAVKQSHLKSHRRRSTGSLPNIKKNKAEITKESTTNVNSEDLLLSRKELDPQVKIKSKRRRTSTNNIWNSSNTLSKESKEKCNEKEILEETVVQISPNKTNEFKNTKPTNVNSNSDDKKSTLADFIENTKEITLDEIEDELSNEDIILSDLKTTSETPEFDSDHKEISDKEIVSLEKTSLEKLLEINELDMKKVLVRIPLVAIKRFKIAQSNKKIAVSIDNLVNKRLTNHDNYDFSVPIENSKSAIEYLAKVSQQRQVRSSFEVKTKNIKGITRKSKRLHNIAEIEKQINRNVTKIEKQSKPVSPKVKPNNVDKAETKKEVQDKTETKRNVKDHTDTKQGVQDKTEPKKGVKDIKEVKTKKDDKDQTDTRKEIKNKIEVKQAKKEVKIRARKIIFKNHMRVVIKREELDILREKERNSARYMSAAVKCESCVLIFKRKSNYTVHCKKFHFSELPDSEVHMCNICGCKFVRNNEFLAHVEGHNRCFKCLWCDHKYLYWESLQEHVKSTHTNSFPYSYFKCHRCEANFVDVKSLNTHLRRKHKEENFYSRLRRHRICATAKVACQNAIDTKNAMILRSNAVDSPKNAKDSSKNGMDSSKTAMDSTKYTRASVKNAVCSTKHDIMPISNATTVRENAKTSMENVTMSKEHAKTAMTLMASAKRLNLTTENPKVSTTKFLTTKKNMLSKKTKMPSTKNVLPSRKKVITTTKNVIPLAKKFKLSDQKRIPIVLIPKVMGTTENVAPKMFKAPTANEEMLTENVEMSSVNVSLSTGNVDMSTEEVQMSKNETTGSVAKLRTLEIYLEP